MSAQRRVGVLLGGWGEEREISLRSGEAIAAALASNGHDVVKVLAGPGLDGALREAKVDVAFVALHGRMGEDGKVQGLLEVLGLPYTGSGVLASALAMNKGFAKRLFRQHNLATPPGYTATTADLARAFELHLDLGFPCVVKPAQGGSSVGLSLVRTPDELAPAIALACRYGGEALVERYVKGREVTVGVLGGEVLGACEVSHGGATFDHQSKYDGSARLHLPPRLGATRLANVEAMALSAWRALGCRGAARIDFLCPDVGNEVLLEVNTLPGLTPVSLLPRIALARGLSFPALCERLLELAGHDVVEPAPVLPAAERLAGHAGTR